MRESFRRQVDLCFKSLSSSNWNSVEHIGVFLSKTCLVIIKHIYALKAFTGCFTSDWFINQVNLSGIPFSDEKNRNDDKYVKCHLCCNSSRLKSSFSEKSTKIWKNLPLVLTVLSKNSCSVKKGGWFFQILWPSHNVLTLSCCLTLRITF